MNVLFLSPAFPPNAYLFCAALARRGARVLAIGDSPHGDVRPELAAALAEYVWVPSLGDHAAVLAQAAGLARRHGPLDWIDAQIELWLELAARLRDDLDVPGPREAELRRQRSKSGMAEIFDRAGIPRPRGERVTSLARALAFGRAEGYPLIFKPDTGAGAVSTFTADSEAALPGAFARATPGHILQRFVSGDIVTFDGLTDREGRVVFCTSHRYDTGIMQVVSGGLDGHYYSLRAVPPSLDAIGRRAVAAFDVRSRFFHLEFFDTPGGHVALEMNLRPPGGFTTDMMNYAADIDVYDLWARIVVGERPPPILAEPRYHAAHAGRRDARRYRLSHGELLAALGETLVWHRRLPREFSAMQGDEMYLLRHPDLEGIERAIGLVQAPA